MQVYERDFHGLNTDKLRTDVRGQKSEIRGQKTEDGGQKSEIRDQRTEDGDQLRRSDRSIAVVNQ
jgi:hypothetical protein